MKSKYKIAEITHSGRKGIRGEKVSDYKYEGLIGYKCVLDPLEIRQFESFHFPVYGSPVYDWWDTSEVLAVGVDIRDESVILETVNTIYKFEKIEEKHYE